MAEGTTDEVKDIDILVGKLHEWTKEKDGQDKGLLMLKYVGHEELLRVSKILSNILPKLEDDSLYKIDEILYPDQKLSDYEPSQRVLYAKELFERIDMSRYLSSYYLEVKQFDTVGDILYDYTLLKVAKYLPRWTGDLYRISEMLLDSGNEKVVCLGLKFLKIVFEGKFAKNLQTRELCSLVSNCRDIPIPKDPIKQEIASFIANLSKECYDKFDEKYKVPDNNSSPKIKIINSIHYILYNCEDKMPICHRNILYTIFASVKDQETKRKYLEWFVRSIDTSCLRNLYKGFKVFTCCLLGSISNSESEIRDDIMRLIDIDNGRNIEPYLPGVDVPIDSKKLWQDEKNKDETDYTFEKFFFYDEVMKNLHLLKIFYTAAAECNKSICEGEYDNKDYTKAFRDDEDMLQLIGLYLINKDRKVPWYLEKTLEMCPFIIFPLEQKDLVFDLIRVLRRKIDVSESKELNDKIKQMKDCYNNRWKVGDPIQFTKPPIFV